MSMSASETTSKTALIIFAKRPALGNGKQRLAKDTSKEIALTVAKYLLSNTLNIVEEYTHSNFWPYDVFISPSSKNDTEWAHSLLDRNIICIPQHQGNLGQRLMQVDREVRMLGYYKTIFIGTDAPSLKLSDLEQAQNDLNVYQQTFIPATDGGVVLMASCRPWKDLDTVAWSTEKVFMQLKSIAIQQGLSFRSYAAQTDLDDLVAFKQLKNKLIDSPIYSLLKPYLDK